MRILDMIHAFLYHVGSLDIYVVRVIILMALSASFNFSYAKNLIFFNLPLQVTYLWMLLQEHIKYKKPTSLFEHFIIAGLHPDANLEVVEDAFVKNKKWQSEMPSSVPTLEPQVDCLIESFSQNFFSIFNNI